MDVYVIKHLKSGKFIASARGVISRNSMRWSGDKSKVKFDLTDKIGQARLLDDVNFSAVKSCGCEALRVKSEGRNLKIMGRVIDHG